MQRSSMPVARAGGDSHNRQAHLGGLRLDFPFERSVGSYDFPDFASVPGFCHAAPAGEHVTPLGNNLYRPEMHGLDVPGDIYVHVAGIDIVKVAENTFYVLEGRLRLFLRDP